MECKIDEDGDEKKVDLGDDNRHPLTQVTDVKGS